MAFAKWSTSRLSRRRSGVRLTGLPVPGRQCETAPVGRAVTERSEVTSVEVV